MPYSITTKDGITIQNIPDDVPPDAPELRDRVARIRAGAGAIQPEEPKPVGNPSRLKGSALGGVAMGLRDAIDGGAQLLVRGANMVGLAPDSEVQRVDQIVKDANAEYGASRKLAGRDGIDAARVVGNIANPVNYAIPMSGAATVGQIAARGAVAGGLSGALQPVLETDNFAATKLAQTGTGAAFGAGGSVVADKALRGVANAANRVRQTPIYNVMTGAGPAQSTDDLIRQAAQQSGVDWSKVSPALRSQVTAEANKALRTGKMPDMAAILRQAEAKTVLGDDASLMLGQATRDPQQFASELDLRGVAGAGKPIADRLSLQNQRMIEKVGGMGAKNAPDAYDAGAAIIKNLQQVDDALSKDVTAAYTAFRNATGSRVDVPLPPLAQKVGEVLDTYGKENVPAAVLSKLNEYGLLGTKQTKVFDLLEADKLIKVINANFDPMKAPQAGALGQLRKGLQEAIDLADVQSQGASGPAAQLLKDALGKAKARFSLHEAVPALEAAAMDKAGKQAFVQRYITSRAVEPDRLAGLVKLMSPDAQAAMRSTVLADILEKAAPGAGRGSDAALFSQAGFNRALDSIGDRKLKIIFGDETTAQLRQIARVAEWIQKQPKGSAVNNSNTGAAMANMLMRLSDSRLMSAPGLNMVKNSLAQAAQEGQVRGALAANIRPQTPQLTPEEINLLRAYLPQVGGAVGALSASSLQ